MKKREESRNQFILAGLWAWKEINLLGNKSGKEDRC